MKSMLPIAGVVLCTGLLGPSAMAQGKGSAASRRAAAVIAGINAPQAIKSMLQERSAAFMKSKPNVRWTHQVRRYGKNDFSLSVRQRRLAFWKPAAEVYFNVMPNQISMTLDPGAKRPRAPSRLGKALGFLRRSGTAPEVSTGVKLSQSVRFVRLQGEKQGAWGMTLRRFAPGGANVARSHHILGQDGVIRASDQNTIIKHMVPDSS